MDKYLVLIGDEYGVNILNNLNLNFVDLDIAIKIHDKNMEEYNCSVILKVTEIGLEIYKSKNDF